MREVPTPGTSSAAPAGMWRWYAGQIISTVGAGPSGSFPPTGFAGGGAGGFALGRGVEVSPNLGAPARGGPAQRTTGVVCCCSKKAKKQGGSR